jgi:ParB family chromosome partitioning protein
MTDQTSFDLPLTQIVIPNDRTRALDPVWAEGLAALMKAQGQINPISVRKINDGAYVLVSGLHRHAGAMLNGATTIRCTLSAAATDAEARIEEVMENLGRHELNALDRCHHLYELKKAYEEAYPQTKKGGDRKSEKIKTQSLRFDPDAEEPQVFGFAKATADQIGLSQRSIQMAVKIWSGLTTESQYRLQGTPFARKQSDLALLSAQIPRIQDRVLNILLADEPEYHSIADAVALVTKGHVPEDTAKRFRALNVNLRKLPDPDFDRLLLENEERVIASLKRQGVLKA